METGVEQLGAPEFTSPLAGVLLGGEAGCQEQEPLPLSPGCILATRFPLQDLPQQQPLLQFLVDSFRVSVHLQKYTYACMSPSDLQAGVLPIPLYGHCSFYCSRPAGPHGWELSVLCCLAEQWCSCPLVPILL